MFERLEDRQMFSATPLDSVIASYGSGVLTPEQVTMGELYWSFKQAADLSKYTSEQLQNTTQWALWTVDPTSGNAAGAGFNPYQAGSSIITLNTQGLTSSQVVSQLSLADNLIAFYPLIGGVNASVASPFDEPLFEDQWHLRNTGQFVGSPVQQDLVGVPGEDINVVGAWNLGVSGAGVVVGVVDSGFQTNHPDLSDNWIPSLSTGFGNNTADPHGTAVAGLIGADGNNNFGVVGVAFGAGLVNLDVGTDAGLPGFGAAVLSYRNDVIDIYNLSLSSSFGTRQVVPLAPDMVIALRNAVQFGRPGPDGTPLGNIFVKSSGNDAGHDFPPAFPGFGVWDNANFEGLNASRYTITVGGVDHDGTFDNIDGTVTNFPEAGSSVLAVAPTGSNTLNIGLDTGFGSGIWTTDLTGNNGFNQAGLLDGDPIDPDFTSRFNGTSASAPIVSGVIALMLEANPNLSWRDVQEILVRSARQNDPTNESWQTNLMEVFEDPDSGPVMVLPEMMDPPADPPEEPVELFLPLEDPFSPIGGSPFGNSERHDPAPHPIDNFILNQLPRFDNGAGFTVSDARGRFSEGYGWGHGVVDAELAVQLAKQWTSAGQSLAPELTYTTFVRQFDANIPASIVADPDGARIRIPGGFGGRGTTFGDFYNEFFADEPFTQDDQNSVPINDRGRSLILNVLEGFDPPDMQIEWVEVKVQITGGASDINELRLAVRSPDGTLSELNQFIRTPSNTTTINFLDEGLLIGGLSSPADGGETFVYTFSTNRHWGERSDAFFEVDPTTGDPLLNPDTGAPILRSWELVVENYSSSDLTFDALEVVFHGTPIGENTERIQGNVGVDAGTAGNPSLRGDGNFNFDRYIELFDNDGVLVGRVAEPDPEPFAANITVRARDTAGNIVDQFITGADGNYYFDLAPGTYSIEIVDPQGRTVLQDAGADPRYQSSWTVTIDPFDAFTRVAGRETDNGEFLYYNDVDFLLAPGEAPATTVQVSGTVYADVNENGVVDGGINGADTAVPGFRVYADTNNSGAFESGEPNAFTDQFGNYSFTIPGITALQTITIAATAPPGGWVATNPMGGKQTILRGPGEAEKNLKFLFQPPANSDPSNPPGEPGALGIIIGQVFSDQNGNGVQDLVDSGVSGIRVFVDLDGEGDFDANEPSALTNEFGGYLLSGVAPGETNVTLVLPANHAFTAPLSGVRQVDLADGGILSDVSFGIQNLATQDFGDLLGEGYFTTGSNAARHQIISGFILGNKIDGELDGQPTANADGDDAVGGDEDGVVLLGQVGNATGVLVAGTTNVVQVSVQGVGGYLNAWMDFNNDGDFADDGEHILVDVDLNPGTHSGVNMQFQTPADMAPGPIAARFRWGTGGLNYFGPDSIGEVEDYLLSNFNSPTVVGAVGGDFDLSGTVDQTDFELWRNTFGSTTNLAADGNGNGVVDAGDYSIWRDHLGQSVPAGGGSGAASAVTSPSGPRASYTLTGEAALAALEAQRIQRGYGTPSADLLALMQSVGATAVTLDLGAGNTRTIFLYEAASADKPIGGAGLSTADSLTETVSSTTSGAAASTALASGDRISLAPLQFSTIVAPREFSLQALPSDRVTQAQAPADLLIVDELLAQFANDDDSSEADQGVMLAGDRENDEAHHLALAAAFDEETDWRLAL